MNEAARIGMWLDVLKIQSDAMTLAASLALIGVFAASIVTTLWPRAGRWLPWLGVGTFHATLLAFWLSIR